MIISKVITIPKNTTEPEVLFRIKLTGKYVLYKLYIDIPTGWEYSAGIQIILDSKDYIPDQVSQGGDKSDPYISGNDSYYDLIPFKNVEESIEIIGINNDPDNDHTCVVTMLLFTQTELELAEKLGGVE